VVSVGQTLGVITAWVQGALQGFSDALCSFSVPHDEWLLGFLNVSSALLPPSKGLFLCSIESEGLVWRLFPDLH